MTTKSNASNKFTKCLAAAVTVAGLAFWVPHGIEKWAAIAGPTPQITESINEGKVERKLKKSDSVFGGNHEPTIAAVYFKLKQSEDALGIDILGLPDRDGASSFEQLSIDLQLSYLLLSRKTMIPFAILEGVLVTALVIALARLLARDDETARKWLMGTFGAGLVFSAMIMAAHISGGLRTALPSQMGFVGFHLASLIAIATIRGTRARAPKTALQCAEQQRESRSRLRKAA